MAQRENLEEDVYRANSADRSSARHTITAIGLSVKRATREHIAAGSVDRVNRGGAARKQDFSRPSAFCRYNCGVPAGRRIALSTGGAMLTVFDVTITSPPLRRLAVLTAAALMAVPLSAQSPPRAPDGHPDLQGTWNFSSLTPLERPAQFVDKPVLTDTEAREFERQTLERIDADRPRDTAQADVAQAYNNAWYDRGTRVVGTKRSSLIIDPPDGRIPPLTASGQAAAAARAEARRGRGPADGPEDRSLTERCLLFNAGPPLLPGPYNNNLQIIQTRDYVVIANEMIHDVRIMPIDGRPHLPAAIRRWQGDPRGHWDGDTLVVETTNFSNRTNFRGADMQLRLVERFRRIDAKTVDYQFTVDDPSVFSWPWTVSLPMTASDGRIYEYACHEANYAMAGILRGARAQEKEK